MVRCLKTHSCDDFACQEAHLQPASEMVREAGLRGMHNNWNDCEVRECVILVWL